MALFHSFYCRFKDRALGSIFAKKKKVRELIRQFVKQKILKLIVEFSFCLLSFLTQATEKLMSNKKIYT